MRFLADMGLAHSTVAFLRACWHDATHLRDEGLQRLSDDRIVEKALSEKRIILTHDLDFGRISALSRGGGLAWSLSAWTICDLFRSTVTWMR